MKPIEITTKLKPFSHQPGISIPYPALQLVFMIYPTKLKIIDWKENQKVLMTLKFKFKSPCKKFTVFKDLVNQVIEIDCLLEDNFAKIKLHYDPKNRHFVLALDRYKEDYLSFEVSRPNKTAVIRRQLTKKKPLVIFNELQIHFPQKPEMLFLGSHKKQEIEKIFERKSLIEILPLWYLWGQFCPPLASDEHVEGNLIFLGGLQEKIRKKEHDKILPYLENIFSSSFAPMMIPYLEDFKHWGFFLPKITSSRLSPWLVLSELYSIIRQFFIVCKEPDLYILPHLPPELFCGKLIRIKVEGLVIYLEWTKKMIHRMIVFCNKNTQMTIHFQNAIKSYRLKTSRTDKGKIFENHIEMSFKKNKVYHFDRFEK